jgi:hypothetical protein
VKLCGPRRKPSCYFKSQNLLSLYQPELVCSNPLLPEAFSRSATGAVAAPFEVCTAVESPDPPHPDPVSIVAPFENQSVEIPHPDVVSVAAIFDGCSADVSHPKPPKSAKELTFVDSS